MENNLDRNRPAREGSNNDQHLRDQSAIQPGADTIKQSETDGANQQLSETAGDGFREGNKDQRADPRFDEDRTKDGL